MSIAEPFAVALLLIALGYAGFVGWMTWRVRRAAPPRAVPEDDALPHVAIVVAARDEEAHLPRCLQALRAQDYPPDRIEIWVADDHSKDRTADVVHQFAAADGIAIHYVRVPDPSETLRGKALALHTAIEAAPRATVLLITDADCAPEPMWARRSAAHFADADTGLLCGLARIVPRPDRAFDRAQALEWILMLGAGSALAEAGQTAMGMGNNMAVRRDAYDAVGGYPALPFSVTEDFTLVRAITEDTPWRVRFPLDPETTVWTHPADGLAATYVQRRRWARGGLTGGGWVVSTYVLLHVVHLLPLVGLFIAPGAAALALLVKCLSDAGFLTAVLSRAGDPHPLCTVMRDVLMFEAFLFGYMVTLPTVLLLMPGIDWKGRRH